jgi:hypothetical protein
VLPRTQQGVALIILLALLGIVVIGVLLTIARSSAEAVERDKRTIEALAKAKEASSLTPYRCNRTPLPSV